MDQPSITLIRPSVSQACVIEKISELYQLEVLKIRKLEGYDDLNFFVECKSLEDGGKAEKYVCKIMNNVDSLETGVIEAHHQMMERLHEGGIVVSQPVLNIRKQYFTTERFNDVGHVFRLLTYIEGSKLYDNETSPELYYNVGELAGKIYQGFKGFENEALRARKCSWMLKNAPKIIQFLPAIGDTGRQEIVKSFVKEFDELVTPVIPCLESGVIHGDMNGHNLLVDGTRIAGLIDFGDSCYGPVLFEIAICLAHMVTHAKDLSVGREVLKGYQKYRQLTNTEIRLLRTCVCARLCQCLVLCCQSALQNPGNEYVTSGQKRSWFALQRLFLTTEKQLLSLWGLEKS